MKQTISVLFLSLLFLLILLPLMVVMFSNCVSVKTEIRLFLTGENRVITLELEEYIKGVVAAEMPANFHVEALKAQAVAARTVTVKRMKRFGGPGYSRKPEADLSDDFRESQAWLSKRELRKKWGLWGFSKNWARISRAVEETRGMILTYQGRPIDAVYHSTSGPRTENACDLWGVDYPYLQSVVCPYCRHSLRYSEVKTVSLATLQEKLGLTDALKASGGWKLLRVETRTAGGRIKRFRLGEERLRGEDFRLKVGLNSANFQYRISGNSIRFQTIGYGHGVGMCQYGADGMAKVGRSFQQILTYYYQGVKLKRLK